MSLDVYLTMKGLQNLPNKSCIFIRENGEIKEINREEWDKRYPGREPHTVELDNDDEGVYSANITHNLTDMASEAGIYKHLWRPDEINITKANQLILPLREGLALLKSDPERFMKYNPDNGWGNYDGLVRFVKKYLSACEEYPDADISVSR